MGLDIVELVMEVEDAFDVRIPDSEAERILTIGDLHRFLLRRIGFRAGAPCLSGVTFYRVRRAFMELGVPRRRVTPRSDLEELLPAENRRVLWDRFGRALAPLRLPALTRPSWLFVVAAVASLATFGAAAVALHGRPDEALWYAGLASGVLGLAALAYRLTAPLAVGFPNGCTTVRDVVLDVLEDNRGAIADGVLRAGGVISPEQEREVWDTLRRIIGKNVGADPDRLTEAMRWQDVRPD